MVDLTSAQAALDSSSAQYYRTGHIRRPRLRSDADENQRARSVSMKTISLRAYSWDDSWFVLMNQRDIERL